MKSKRFEFGNRLVYGLIESIWDKDMMKKGIFWEEREWRRSHRYGWWKWPKLASGSSSSRHTLILLENFMCDVIMRSRKTRGMEEEGEGGGGERNGNKNGEINICPDLIILVKMLNGS